MRPVLALLLTAGIALSADLPKVLILGDSISIGYTKPVQELLSAKAEVRRPNTNCQYTAFGLKNIDAWLGDTRWDVIHFNWGLHDLKYIAQDLPDSRIIRKRGEAIMETPGAHQLTEVDAYAANLEKLVMRLKQTRAALIFATTTPVPEGAEGRIADDASRYNEAAVAIMRKHGVAVNDLHAFAAARLDAIQIPQDVHFKPEGSRQLAAQVARSIRGALANEPGDRSAPPNFVFIMADDLGYGDVSCFGSKTIRTPHLDALARRGVTLTDYHSNGAVCSPTRAALMTGKYQQRVGVPGVINARAMRDTGMALEHVTIAEALKPHGYRSALFGKWHLGYPAAFNPTAQGFDEFRGFVSGNVDYQTHVDQAGYFDWWQQSELKDEPGYITDLINHHGVEFIKRQSADAPFALFLMHGAPHYPYQGRDTPGFRKPGQQAPRQTDVDILPLYKEMIEVMDEGIGMVVAELDAQGLRDNTVVVFCSDNGPTKEGSSGGLRGTKGTVWEGGHRVPGIVSWPARLPGGSTNDTTILGMDWFPTFLAVAGITPPADLDGTNIMTALSGFGPIPLRTLFWQHGRDSAVRQGPWKLVVPKRGAPELFNLAKDPSESHNLATAQPERLRNLRDALSAWEASLTKP